MHANNPNPITWRTALLLILLGALGLFLLKWDSRRQAVPTEVVAGLQALYEKFDGPGYFHIDPAATNRVSRRTYLIPVPAAHAQIERVLRERSHTNAQPALETLIRQLAEAPESRAFGESQVNVLRLNLALDEELRRAVPQ